MNTEPLPAGWELEGWQYSPHGCLVIILSDPLQVIYLVCWHVDGTVTCLTQRQAGNSKAFDPLAVGLALLIADANELSPRYHHQTGPWN